MKRIGVALGAGGARGLAQIAVLQAFEELGIRPSIVSGTSIGAVIGVALAAGLSAAEMKEAVEEIRSSKPGRFWHIYDNSELRFAIALLDPTMETGGLIKGEKFIRFLESKIKVQRFEDLKIPLWLVATNYWKREQVILSKGNLLNAVRASYSMPGLFTPVKIGKDLLVDGGLMNPLPYDIIQPHCASEAQEVVASCLTSTARVFVGAADGVDRVLDGKVWGDPTYANDHLVMKWSKGWDDARFHGAPWTTDAWEDNEWNGKVPGGSGEVWHYKIVWVGPALQNSPYWREGGYAIWGQFEVIFSHGTVANEHFWDAHAKPTGYGLF